MEYLEVYRSPDFYDGAKPAFDGPPEGGLYTLRFKRRVYPQQGEMRGSSAIDAYFHVPYSAVLWLKGGMAASKRWSQYYTGDLSLYMYGSMLALRIDGQNLELPMANVSVEVGI